jgi:hypothetical protein
VCTYDSLLQRYMQDAGCRLAGAKSRGKLGEVACSKLKNNKLLSARVWLQNIRQTGPARSACAQHMKQCLHSRLHSMHCTVLPQQCCSAHHIRLCSAASAVRRAPALQLLYCIEPTSLRRTCGWHAVPQGPIPLLLLSCYCCCCSCWLCGT